MHSDTGQSAAVAVEVDLPADLLAEIDNYASTRGYRSPDAVVREALDRLE